MKPGKFSSTSKREVKAKELQEKLEVLALALADEAISGKKTLLGVADLEEGLAVLKTLGNHWAMVNKVDVPDPEGNAFDEYKKRVAGGSRGGDSGNPPDAGNVVKLEFSDLFPSSKPDAGGTGEENGSGPEGR